MNSIILPASSKNQLTVLHDQLTSLRSQLDISSPRTLLYSATLSSQDDEILFVEADGFGGAKMNVVTGHYPFDYVTNCAKYFDTESAAVAAAEEFFETSGH